MSHRRSFVAHHTRLRPIPGLRDIRLHLADDAVPVWQATEATTGVAGAPIPFWAFAWAGGLGLARWLQAHPEAVAGRTVLDFGAGSGLVAIAAARAGAEHVLAVDVDPFAEAAVELNARANHVHLTVLLGDMLDEDPPAVDVLLAADTWYESRLADRVLPWLRRAADRGVRVIVGDPGRKYLPDAADAGFVELASYRVPTTTTLEDRDVVESRVYEIRRRDRGIVA
jgi:predicted nicotinamide N-methyase